MYLSEIVSPDSFIARSINIERDREDPHTLRQYLLTDKGTELITRFANSIAGEKTNAWSVTGPYGMGKSAFVNFLSALGGSKDSESTTIARQQLAAFNPHLHGQSIDIESGQLATFDLAALYDFFLHTTNTISMNRPESKRWFEVNTIVEDSRHFPAIEHELVKIIGLLNLLARPGSIRASADIVQLATLQTGTKDTISAEQCQAALQNLISRGVVLYRDYADEYRLWEGTDIDVAAEIAECKTKLRGRTLWDMLQKNAPMMPLTAARHSYESGTLRHFERQWIAWTDIQAEKIKSVGENSDGLILYCLGSSDEQQPSFPAHTLEGKPVVVAYSRNKRQIYEAVAEVESCRMLLAESAKLTRDSVARREAHYRAGSAEKRLRQLIESLYRPGNQDTRWWHGATKLNLSNHRSLSATLSTICDKTYRHCPTLRNELINRNKLSSATSRARRELMDAMVANENLPDLGLQGTGPEVAIYRTMLRAENLHQEKQDNTACLVPPLPGSNYYPAWLAMEELLANGAEEPVPIIAFINLLCEAPYGLKKGPVPLLLCLFLIVRQDETALYRENVFIPYLSSEEMELLAKRPELFAVKHFAPSGIEAEIFEVYRRLLNTSQASAKKKIRNATMLSVVGPLMTFANNLPAYVCHTRSLSKPAQKVLTILLQANDPMQMLFKDLPLAVGMKPFDTDSAISEQDTGGFQAQLRTALVELTGAFPRLLKTIQSVFLETIQVDKDESCS